MTYKEIITKNFEIAFDRLSQGMYKMNLNSQTNIKVICLLDKTFDDFRNYCKKNGWKLEELSIPGIIDVPKNYVNRHKENEPLVYESDYDEYGNLYDKVEKLDENQKKERKSMIKKLCKRVAVASMVAVASIALFTGCVKNEGGVGNQIAVEQDATGGDGDRINEKEVLPQTINPSFKKGEALIEGEVVYDNGQVKNETYRKKIEGVMGLTSKPEVHTWTAYNSTTLGETVLVDNNTKSGERQVYRQIDNGAGLQWERVFINGKGKKDEPMEQALKAYQVMRGVAKAIDGNK